jgi:hypothetical protein
MAAPIVTITSISRTKISDEPGATQSIVKFKVNQAIIAWEARAGGMFPGSGLLVGNGGGPFPSSSLYPSTSFYPDNYSVAANTEIQFEVDYTELQQDGDYQINVYAANALGEWSAYGS